jgi:UDPglucose 6-dehydrogenase
MLHRARAEVTVFDPKGTENARRVQPALAYAFSLDEAVTGADLVCVLTEWAEFREADPMILGELVAARRVIDGRNCLDADRWRRAGWTYCGMGRGRATGQELLHHL